ncbi:hypothetical protein JOD24_002043 [Kroppenstedtia sanguinis]|uniref:SMI1/KNR4 family protein n=1 Tax=Kroppenstedtia TaxID=1274351 RepID=UPI00363317CD
MGQYILWEDGKELPRDRITEVEEYLGIRFPEAYVRIVMEHNGASPIPGGYSFTGPEGERLGDTLYLIPFSAEKSAERQNIVLTYFDSLERRRLPERVYPFANGSGGDMTCFDYRDAPNGEPRILWWCHDEWPNHRKLRWGAIYPVCDSFSELLDKLEHDFEWVDVREPVSRERIREVEREWGVSLPEDYVECVMENNGGRPVPNRFRSGEFGKKQKHVLKRLLSLDGYAPEILSVYQRVQGRIANGVYPIAACDAEDYVCLDYRDVGREGPKITLWQQEEDEYRSVADQFIILLAKFYD